MAELKKIGEYEWEIPKTGKMKVPGKIFASEKLLEKIKQDKTIEQIQNVACLPGIIKASIAMADAHQGYGFSIGGVAAFPIETGIVSPGGVGFDINCLTGDTRILTEFGASIPIKNFGKITSEIESNGCKLLKNSLKINLQTLNLESKKQEIKPINFFMSKKSSEVYEIKTNSGLKIKATLDHPFLTKKGMKELKNLKKNEEIAVDLFQGINYQGEIHEELAIIAKIMGYMFGDGTLYESKGKLRGCCYGQLNDLETIKKDLEKINVKSNIYSRNRDHEIKTKYGLVKFNTTNHELHINSKEFLKKLIILGMPVGNKTRINVNIPEWIKKSNKLLKRLFLAGFFGAELSSPKTSSKTCFFCPTIDQNKIEKLSQNMRDFLTDITLLLEEFGIKNTTISEFDDFENRFKEKTKRFRIFIRGEEDTLKLWKNIGFEYNEKRKKVSDISILYLLLKKQENKKRVGIAKKVKDYKERGFNLRDIQRIFNQEINSRFIERHYYENAKQRINLDFISFNEFLKEKLSEIEDHGTIFDNIQDIKKINEEFEVYDFNVKDNHNFIANNFVVSNCGIRALATDIPASEFLKKRKEFLQEVYRAVPSGVGELL